MSTTLHPITPKSDDLEWLQWNQDLAELLDSVMCLQIMED